MSDQSQMNEVITEVTRLREKLTSVNEALHEVVMNLERHAKRADPLGDGVQGARGYAIPPSEDLPDGLQFVSPEWVPGPGDPVVPPEPVEHYGTPEERHLWVAQYGYDVYARGMELYRKALTLRDTLGISWKDVGKLLAAAPVYNKDGAPEPLAESTVPALKYPPYWRRRRNGEWAWQYALVDADRRQACWEAIHHWADRLNIDVGDAGE